MSDAVVVVGFPAVLLIIGLIDLVTVMEAGFIAATNLLPSGLVIESNCWERLGHLAENQIVLARVVSLTSPIQVDRRRCSESFLAVSDLDARQQASGYCKS